MRLYLAALLVTCSFSACGTDPGPWNITLPQGPRGEPGQDGAKGDQGDVGPQGPAGVPGLAAPSVTSVQFCAGTATYASSFPESGLCIGGKLYGVFWMGNKAWLGEIPPGHYASTSTGPTCSFTVGANCQVSQ